ncbi:MAG: 23S rRNA (uracil(1939)-C(5))-methyltransferase RlmD [Acidobacteriota bacterium]|nr:MAG: 23S rRNA (uracil(1939)-C(5))-methyltransferase RlmD [Acidobacteriota bacterium]
MTSFDVEIEKIVAGGDGLARHAGRVIFVPATAPGERHRVEIVHEKKDYLRGTSVACLESSASRREPPCMYYGRCGGCSLMQLDLEAQLEAKKGILLESLSRGGVETSDVQIVLTPSPEENYRTRLRFHVSSKRGRRGKRACLEMGFHLRGSHQVENIENCRHAGRGLNECWRQIKRFFESESSLTRGLVSVELQESSHDAGRVVGHFLVQSSDELRRFDRDVRDALLHRAMLEGLVVAAGSHDVHAGQPYVHHQVGQVLLRQSVGAFFQTNRFLLDKLVEVVSPEAYVERLVDLYCGVGLFSIPLARHARDIVGVETSPIAVGDAVANAEVAGVGRARFVCADAARFAEAFRFRRDDYVIVDPPRGGLPRALTKALAKSPVRRICYVSCDPPALARDAAAFLANGFRLARVDLLDFFPNTHHFETVATLSRPALDSTPPVG